MAKSVPVPEPVALPDMSPIFEAIGNLADRTAALESVPKVEPQTVDLSPVLDRVAALEQKPAVEVPVSVQAHPVDLSPLIEFCEALARRQLDLETLMQRLLQDQSDAGGKIAMHEQLLDTITSVRVFDLDVKKAG
jgi:hypothetical protein